LFSSRGQWKEANQLYEEALGIYRKTGPPCAVSAAAMRGYCWALLQQGRFADAKAQFEEARNALDSLEKRFEHSNVHVYLVAPVRVDVGKKFNMRLDLVNVGKNSGVLVGVESLAPEDFRIIAAKPKYNMQNGSVDLEKSCIKPFTDEAITFTVQATKAGVFSLNPQLIYIDDLGENKTCKINPVTVTVQPQSN
jgi:tetratricopeptide (TPR) repeat protein